MPTDLEIIAELEREIGKKLPRRELDQNLPSPKQVRDGNLAGTDGGSFEDFVNKESLGYFVDGDESVVGLALNAVGLKTLPRPILRLTHLKKLTLHENELETLPEQTAALQDVEELGLARNQLSSLPPCVLQLSRLKRLWVGRNKLTTLPEGMGSLQELEDLFMYENQIETLPTSISTLKHLKRLTAFGNKIKALPPWIFDMGLEIHVERYSINAICLHDNPLESPPVEIIKRGNEAVRAYFASLEGERLRLNEVKVLLVGDGGAGKTCLVKRLLEEGFNPLENQTDGINIDSWKIDADGQPVKAHLWDFGGQEIMHATHQFFLSERSVYVLVLDGRKEEDAEYWLKHIESFGGDSPVLVVLNKMDENPGFDVNRKFLTEKYKGVVDFHRVSCKSGKGIEAFREGLTEAIGRVEMIRTTWPKSWFDIKTQLEEMSEPYIGAETYREMCRQSGMDQEGRQDTLVDFLRDLGVIVHFPDLHLQHMHVLEPRWLTGAVYRIINSHELAEKHGLLKVESLKKILKRADGDKLVYLAEHYPYIVEMMKKFELCYSIDRNTVLIPDLLDVQEPEIDFDYDNSLRFRIDYDFLPRSVIPRFIVRKSASIVGDLRWRTGVVLEDPAFEARAVVKADVKARRIYIYVGGPQRQDFLTVVRSAFLDINRGFEKLGDLEMVPLFDEPGIAISYGHLVHLAKEGVKQHYPDGASRAYEVDELLGTLQVQRQRTDEEFLRLLKSALAESDDEKSLLKKADDIISFQPGFMGLNVDVKALVAELFKRRKK